MVDVTDNSDLPELRLDGPIAAGWRDLTLGIKHWRIYVSLAWHGLLLRYKRSWLSMAWISIAFGLFALVKIAIFGTLTDTPIAFFAGYLALGYLGWRVISNFVVGGSNVFIGAQNWIKSERLPISIHLFKLVVNNFITMGFHLIPAVAICVYFGMMTKEFFYSLPFVVVIFALNGIWVSSIVGIVCARFRDVMHLLVTIVQVLYFATPILWVPSGDGIKATVAKYNPLTYYLSILRDPAIEGTIPWHSWQLVGMFTCAGLVLSFFVFVYSRKNVIYWL